jgi:hypothetical protein
VNRYLSQVEAICRIHRADALIASSHVCKRTSRLRAPASENDPQTSACARSVLRPCSDADSTPIKVIG